MRNLKVVILCAGLLACTTKPKYDIGRYYDAPEQERILTEIVSYIFTAPPNTKMEDRFLPLHHAYYSRVATRFSILKYFIADDGTHYFYILRPGPDSAEKRGVGGHFRMEDDFEFSGFREEFVTPLLPEEEVKGRCAFLFDEMVKGTLGKYLKMESYIQWPGEVSEYDSVAYEWKFKSGMQPME